jgi:hypothetical protein
MQKNGRHILRIQITAEQNGRIRSILRRIGQNFLKLMLLNKADAAAFQMSVVDHQLPPTPLEFADQRHPIPDPPLQERYR